MAFELPRKVFEMRSSNHLLHSVLFICFFVGRPDVEIWFEVYRNLPLIWSDNYERFGSPLFAKIKSFSTITDARGTPFSRCMWQQKINSEFPRHYQKFISGIVQIASPLSFQADARRLDRGSKRNTQTHTNYESSFNFQTTQRIRALRKRKWNYHAWISQWNQLFLRHSHWKPQNNRVFFWFVSCWHICDGTTKRNQ